MSPRAKRGGPSQPGSPRSARGDGTSDSPTVRPSDRPTVPEGSLRAQRSRLAALPIEFIGSWPDPATPLNPPLPEVAFVGRSNVGKSSLLNALVARKGLARVSGTPGKTRLMNVFRLPTFYLVDLPGYGYAKASHSERLGFRKLLDAYLAKREHLAGVVWLLDIRHPPSAEDRVVQEVLIGSGRPVLAVLTKGDKLTRIQRLKAAAERAGELGLRRDDLLVTSAETGEGIADLADSVLAAV